MNYARTSEVLRSTQYLHPARFRLLLVMFVFVTVHLLRPSITVVRFAITPCRLCRRPGFTSL